MLIFPKKKPLQSLIKRTSNRGATFIRNFCALSCSGNGERNGLTLDKAALKSIHKSVLLVCTNHQLSKSNNACYYSSSLHLLERIVEYFQNSVKKKDESKKIRQLNQIFKVKAFV